MAEPPSSLPAVDRDEDEAPVAWFADAPLFIDGQQVSAFYDAVIRPEGETTTTLRITDTKSFERALGFKGSLKAGLPRLIPFLKLGVEAGGEVTRKKGHQEEAAYEIELRGIDTPYRQLWHLGLYYAATVPERLLHVRAAVDATWWRTARDSAQRSTGEWLRYSFILQNPRPLVFLDLPPYAKLIPVAMEVTEGRVIPCYERVIAKMAKRGEPLPIAYPESEAGKGEADLREERKAYWGWFAQFFNPQRAMEVVEEVINEGQGRVRWIDYRLPLGDDGTTMHLHVCGREDFDTGVFAYNMVKRGYKHGLRVVGTLKVEPDLNVLAVFEK